MRCPRCGNENSEMNRFCGMCGATGDASLAVRFRAATESTGFANFSAGFEGCAGHQRAFVSRTERAGSPQEGEFEHRPAIEIGQSRLFAGR